MHCIFERTFIIVSLALNKMTAVSVAVTQTKFENKQILV